MTTEQLRALLESNGLSRIADAVVGLATPSIWLTLTSCGKESDDSEELLDQSAIGTSKIGGDPDLSPDFAWPMWEGIPLTFVAQFNLAEVVPFAVERVLPQSGMLYFFYDVTMEVFISGGERINWKVVHYDGDLSSLSRTPAPSGLPEFGKINPWAIIFRRELSIPNWECVEAYNLFQDLALTEKEKEHYRNFVIEVIEHNIFLAYGKKMEKESVPSHHRLLGYPDVLYSDGRVECVADVDWEEMQEMDEQNKEMLHRGWIQQSLNWRLLFQIDTDYETDLNWGDAGLMFFFIHKEDLHAANFDNVELIYEGH